jgi:hypothetical protein
MRRFPDSMSVTALFRTAAHSSSVFGDHSTTPSSERMVPTESHSTSAAGSTIDTMISLTFACGLNGGPGGAPQPIVEQRPTGMERRIARIRTLSKRGKE